MDELPKLLDQYIKEHGLKMSKKISSGGFFAESTWDDRIAYSRQDIGELTKQGFKPDQDMGCVVFNFLLSIKN